MAKKQSIDNAQDVPHFDPVDPRVNFPEMEKKRLKHWYDSGIVDKYLHKNDSSKKYFSFMDGPITANNPMGVHHAWGRTYKDLWQRYKNMQGFRERFQNGFDCQGLWVEVEVEKELGLRSKKDIENLVPGDKKASIDKFINLCKERVAKFAGIQTEQTKRLGNFMDWEHSYFTLSDENNYMIWHFLKVCHERGWIYKGRDSVPWCPRCETAISQHEMLTEDYKEAVHEAVYFKLPLKQTNQSLLVWTTTPWTIPANVAVAIDKDKKYTKYPIDEGKEFVWVMSDAVERLVKAGVLPKSNARQEAYEGETALVGKEYDAPFHFLPRVSESMNGQPHKVIATDSKIMPISTEEGTGLVHIATGAGSEDFKLGKKEKLPVIEIIDDSANYLDQMGEYSGKNAKKHPGLILDYLKGKDLAIATHHYKHRYPACWRCKTELVWKVADEWYIAMDKVDPTDKKKRTLRKEMMDVAKKITWLPEFGLDRELDWLKNMHDWLISKPNRYWGLALPIYECKKCGNFEVIGSRDELKERAAEGWSEFDGHTPHKPWIDEVKIKCSQCGEIVSRLPDVGNVWLDAGIVPFSTIQENNQGEPLYLKNREDWQKWFPVDFITESFPGQFKNWFYSMIAMSTVLENKNPFKTVLGYATLLAEDGRAMHKSWGNSIEFNEGADKMGADVMRWMFARTNPTDNMLFGYRNADETRRQFHLKLWNVYNFFVTYANTSGWEPNDKKKELTVLDKWVLSQLNDTILLATTALDDFDAQKATIFISAFVDDLSLWYIRRSRDRNDEAFYQTTYEVLTKLSKVLAPFMPYMAEEMYINLTKQDSVHLSDWPQANIEAINREIEDKMKQTRAIVEIAHAKRKEKEIKVRQPLSKLIVKDCPFDITEFFPLIEDELNVKTVDLKIGNKALDIDFDWEVTEDLKNEGEARELVRQIQEERKNMGTALDERINVTLATWPEKFEDYIKSKALIATLSKGEFKVERMNE